MKMSAGGPYIEGNERQGKKAHMYMYKYIVNKDLL